MAALCFDLPFATMSLNRTQRMHWAKLHQHNKVVLATVRLLTKGCGKWWLWPRTETTKASLPRAGGVVEPAKRKVTITRQSSRKLDHDNFVGGCKGLLDVLVVVGLLYDDSPKWAEVEYTQEKCKRGEERTAVLVEDL